MYVGVCAYMCELQWLPRKLFFRFLHVIGNGGKDITSENISQLGFKLHHKLSRPGRVNCMLQCIPSWIFPGAQVEKAYFYTKVMLHQVTQEDTVYIATKYTYFLFSNV